CLDLADKIAADVRTLREDAAAQTGEDGDQRSAETERHQRVDNRAVSGLMAKQDREHPIIDRDAKKGEARNEQAGDSAGLESNVEARGQAVGGGLSGAHIGAYRDIHADVAG